MRTLPLVAVLTAFAAPAFAEGDVAAGEEQFNRQCVSCHVVRDNAGDVLAGRNAKTGPNLYGIAGRALGAEEGFRYGDSLVDAGEAGIVWDEESFVAYVQDPTAWLREATDNARARSKMAYKVRDAQQAADIYAFIASFE
ncbi:MAG: c-type cytochrome [Yoonia sp.]|jgi:cytochrome c|nr:c-type cytochrome [Yoonia sp.]